ncbi:MAG: hypothetical protein WD716_00660 [Fimbriimonadaceae bacterium]
MKRLSTILAMVAAALFVAGCGDSGSSDLEVKEIETDTSGAAPVERSGAGAAEVGAGEVTLPPTSEAESQAMVGSKLGDK